MCLKTINDSLSASIGTNGTIVENVAALASGVGSVYLAVGAKGGQVPAEQNTEGLAAAIETIDTGGANE